MSADFELEPDAAEEAATPQPRKDLSYAELSERLAASVTSYGVGTRSYNRSAEKREMDRQRAEATAKYEASARESFEVPLRCRCPQRPYPHDLSVHTELRRESFNPQLKFRWPWSLILAWRHGQEEDAS